jgi:type I restriction enzyme R subunit
VTYKTEYAQNLINDFSTKEKAPHIAISVDMLDTGIDVPAVVNLVFFKLVRSVSKFWQMIGRGTRLCEDLYGPGDDKANFYVFDFCMNHEYFNQPGAGSEGSMQKSLAQRIFEARLGLVAALDHDDLADEVGALREDTAKHLHKVVTGMNVDNFVVRPERGMGPAVRGMGALGIPVGGDGGGHRDPPGRPSLRRSRRRRGCQAVRPGHPQDSIGQARRRRIDG